MPKEHFHEAKQVYDQNHIVLFQ